MKYLITSLAFLSVLLVSGCATIVSGQNQAINVQAIDSTDLKLIPEAKCYLKSDDGDIYRIEGNPGQTAIDIKKGRLIARCSKKGYKQKYMGVGESFNAWMIADLIFWPTIFVDMVSGAYEKYPSHVTVAMTKIHK